MSPKQKFAASVALDSTAFSIVQIEDPVPLGRQILAAANHAPPEDYSLYAILASGDFEDVRLNEPFDLREKGTERFVAFTGDALYRFFAKGAEVKWGPQHVSEETLRVLTRAKADEAVFLEVDGGTDHLIKPGETVDLAATGVEHFITAKKPVFFHFFVNGTRYETEEITLTGLQIKARVANWDANHDLVLEGHSDDPDRKIDDGEPVDLDVNPARRFSSVPKANFG